MLSTSSRTCASLILACAVPVLVLACSGEPKVGRGPDEPAADAGVSEAEVTDAITERRPKDAGDGACPLAAPAQEAPTIQKELRSGDRPAAIGGMIAPGKYFLTKAETYLGDAGSDDGGVMAGLLPLTITRTVVITEDNLAFREGEGTVDGGIDEVDEHVRSYASVGTILVVRELCPEREPFQIEYSVVGSELHLYPSATQRELLTRQP